MATRKEFLAKAEPPLQRLLQSKSVSGTTEIPVLLALDLPTGAPPALDPTLDPATARRTLIRHYDEVAREARSDVLRTLRGLGLTVRSGESAQTLAAHGPHEAVLNALALPTVKGAYLDAKLEAPALGPPVTPPAARWHHRVDLRCVWEGERLSLLLGRSEWTERPPSAWTEVPWREGAETAPFVGGGGRRLSVRRYRAVLDAASLDGWLDAAAAGRATIVAEQGPVAVASGPWTERPAVIDGPRRTRTYWALDKVGVLLRMLPPERWDRGTVEGALRWLLARTEEGGMAVAALGNFERSESLLGPREWQTGLEVTTDVVQRGGERFASAVHVSFERPLADEKDLWVRCRLFNGSTRTIDLIGRVIEERSPLILDELQRWSARGVLRFEAREAIERVEVEVWRASDGALVAVESAHLVRDVSVKIRGDSRPASLVPELIRRWPVSREDPATTAFSTVRWTSPDPWRASTHEAERLLAPLRPASHHVTIPAGDARRTASLRWVADRLRDVHEAMLVLRTLDPPAMSELLGMLGERPLDRWRLVILVGATPGDADEALNSARGDVQLEVYRVSGAGAPEALVCHDGLGGEKAWLLAPGLTDWERPFVATVASPRVVRSLFEGAPRERIAPAPPGPARPVVATPENPFDEWARRLPSGEEPPSGELVAELESTWDRGPNEAWLLLAALSNHSRDDLLRHLHWTKPRLERLGHILETNIEPVGEEILHRVPSATDPFAVSLERWSRWLDYPDHPVHRAGLHAQTSAVLLALGVAPRLVDHHMSRGRDREVLALVAGGALWFIRRVRELGAWLRSPDVRARSLAAAAVDLSMAVRRDWSDLSTLEPLPPLERLACALWLARRPGGRGESTRTAALDAARRWWPDRLDAKAMAALGQVNAVTRKGAAGWHWLAQFAKNPEDRASLLGRFFGAVQAELGERAPAHRIDEWRKTLPEFWTLDGVERAHILDDWLALLARPVDPEAPYDRLADELARQLVAAYLLAETARTAPDAERESMHPVAARVLERVLSLDWLPLWRGIHTPENLFVALLGLILPRVDDLDPARFVPLALERADTVGVLRPGRLALLLCAAPAARAQQITELADDPATLQSFVALRTQSTAWALVVGRWLRAAVTDGALPADLLPFADRLDRMLPSLPGEQGEAVDLEDQTAQEDAP